MMFLVAVTSLFVSSWIIVRRLPVTGVSTNLLAFLVLIFGQVVLASEVLSELGMISALGYCIFHLSVLALVYFTWPERTANSKRLIAYFREQQLYADVARIPAIISDNKFVALALLALLAVYVYGFWLTFRLTVYNHDTFAYHLLRSAFWLELGTARHFYTNDFRMTEFPPNSSFVATWMMAYFGRGFWWVHLPQNIAALCLGVATVALSRSFGSSRAAAAFSGLLALTFPVVVIQATTAQNDLIVAALGMACLAFCVCYAQGDSGERERNSNLTYAGVSFGSALGTKFTVLYFLPAIALAILVLLFRSRSARGAVSASFVLGSALFAGVLVFGSYNVILNLIAFANPIVSSDTSVILQRAYNDENTDVALNVGRYAFQFLDWPGFATSLSDLLPTLQRSILSLVEGWTGVKLFAGPLAPYERLVGGPEVATSRSAFGPFGYLLFLISIPAMIALVWRAATRRDAKALVIALLIGSLWLAIVVVSATRPWTPNKARYFILGFAILSSLVATWIYDNRRLRMTLVPLMVVGGLWTALSVVRDGDEGIRRENYAWRLGKAGESPLFHVWGGIQAGQFDMMRTVLGPGSSIGIAAKIDVPIYGIIGGLPEMHFKPMPPEQIREDLATGALDAALVTRDFDIANEAVPLVNDPELMLVTRNPHESMKALASKLGLKEHHGERERSWEVPAAHVTTFTQSLFGRWNGAIQMLEVPVGLFEPTWQRVSISLEFEQPVPERVLLEVKCTDSRWQKAEVVDNRIIFPIVRECAMPGALFARMTLRRSDNGSEGPLRIMNIKMTGAQGESPDSSGRLATGADSSSRAEAPK